jgi:hypothetical protein
LINADNVAQILRNARGQLVAQCSTQLFLRRYSVSGGPEIKNGTYGLQSWDGVRSVSKFDDICSKLPESGVRIMGDYNIDFLQMNNNSNIASQFEDSFLANGLSPVISIPTHKRHNCNPSCIDNILTSDIDKILISGTLTDSIGDYMPIFELINIYLACEADNNKQVKYYEYSNANLEKFVKKLEEDLSMLPISENFCEFIKSAIYNKSCEKMCSCNSPYLISVL